MARYTVIKDKQGAEVGYTEVTAADAIDRLKSQMEHPDRDYGTSSIKTSGDMWSGTVTAEDYIDLYRYGWKEGRSKLKSNMKHFKGAVRTKYDLDVRGFTPSIPEFCAGLPENMISAETESKKFVRLLVPYGWSSGVNNDDILKYAGVVASIFQALREQDVGCSVDLILGNSVSGGFSVHRITVCDINEVVDIDKVASCFHTSFWRRACFALIETSEYQAERDATHAGYGMVTQATAKRAMELVKERSHVSNYIELPPLNPQLWQEPDKSKALEECFAEINKVIER